MSNATSERELESDATLIPIHRWFMALFLLIFNVADVVMTKAIIRLGGEERNPVMQPIIKDPALPLVLKSLIAISVGVLLLRAPATSKIADRAMTFVLVAYVIVLGWNLGVLLQAASFHG